MAKFYNLHKNYNIKMSGIKKRTVYMLRRTDGGNEIYIGSTSQPLKKRYMGHIYRAKNFMDRGCSKDNRLYTRMNEVGLGNWRISPLLSRVCNIKTIRDEEKGWVRALNPGLNSYLPVRDEETIEEYRTAYRESHKDKIKAHYEGNMKKKRYYCGLCNVTCMQNSDLKKHLNTLKHSNAYMNSVD